jgi:hypothetical protein
VLKLLQRLFKPPEQNAEVHGNSQKRDPIDFSKEDVEDAEFEEIKE